MVNNKATYDIVSYNPATGVATLRSGEQISYRSPTTTSIDLLNKKTGVQAIQEETNKIIQKQQTPAAETPIQEKKIISRETFEREALIRREIAERQIPEATAIRYSTPLQPYILKKREDEIRMQGAKPPTSEYTIEQVALAYEPPKYAAEKEDIGEFLERITKTPKILPEKLTKPVKSENVLVSTSSEFSAGQMKAIESLPFVVVSMPASIAKTILKPKETASYIVEHPAEFAGQLSIPILISKTPSLVRTQSKIEISDIAIRSRSFGMEGSEKYYIESGGGYATRHGFDTTYYKIKSVTVGKITSETTSKARTLTVAEPEATIRFVQSKGTYEIIKPEVPPSRAASEALISVVEREKLPLTLKTYDVYIGGKTIVKTGERVVKENFYESGGSALVAKTEFSGATKIKAVETYADLMYSQPDLTMTKTLQENVLFRKTKTTEITPVADSTQKTTTTLTQQAAPIVKSQIKTIEKKFKTPQKSAIKDMVSSYEVSSVVGSLQKTKTEQATRHDIITDTLVTERELQKSKTITEQATRHDIITDTLVTERELQKSKNEEKTYISFDIATKTELQQQAQVIKKQKQKFEQAITKPLLPKIPAIPKPKPSIPFIPILPHSNLNIQLKSPKIIKKEKGFVSKPKMLGFGMKSREVGLPDIVFSSALKKPKPVPTGSYGFFKKRRKK